MWTAQLQNKRQTLEMFPKLKKINRLKKNDRRKETLETSMCTGNNRAYRYWVIVKE